MGLARAEARDANCPGLLDDEGAVRAECRVCGKCGAVASLLLELQDTGAAGPIPRHQTMQPATQAAA